MSALREQVKDRVATVHHIFEETDAELPRESSSQFRYWAAQNALTLVFLVVFFTITWIIEICLAVFT